MLEKKIVKRSGAVVVAIALMLTTFSSFKEQASSDELGYSAAKSSGEKGEKGASLQVADFRPVAKKAIPAVVSIKVKGKTTPTLGGLFSDEEGSSGNGSDPMEDFWRNFFGGMAKRRQENSQPFAGLASGFIVGKDGLILTNSHVVRDASEVVVTLNDGREFKAQVVGSDPNIDIALLKIDAKELPYLSLGDSDKLEVGEWVCTIGNPLGLQASLTVGVVSATGRNNLDLTRIEDFIQTDAAINRGNSGGPLLDLAGDVVGINTAIVSNMGGYMGIGFAIPSNMAKYAMEELQSNGHLSRGFVGILLQPIDQNLAQSFQLSNTQGALVAEVTRNSPAEKAGIKQGDIITKLNGKTVHNMAALRNTISLMKPSSKVELTVMREGKTMVIPVEIGEYPGSNKDVKAQFEKLGFEVEEVPAEASQGRAESSVVISKISAGSVAEWAGLQKGTEILEVNHDKVQNVEQFQRALAQGEAGKPILFLVKQKGITRFISLKVS